MKSVESIRLMSISENRINYQIQQDFRHIALSVKGWQR